MHRPEKVIEVALVGNPNSGKTTLFNRVSRSREHVGNYAGVTVDSKEAIFSHDGYTFRITDLPGTYSLSDFSSEERFVREHILLKKPDVVVNVVDANNLERNLYLTSQLIDMDVTVVLALNMYDELLERKDMLDLDLLSKLLGIRVVPTISHRGKGIFRLLNHVIRVFEDRDPDIRHIHINYGEELEQSIQRLQEQIRQTPSLTDHYSSRFLSLKLLEKDDNSAFLISQAPNFMEIQDSAREEGNRIKSLFKEEADTLITDARYGFVAGALKETMKKSGANPGFSRSQRIDRILTHKYLGLPIFLGFLWLMFHATFTLGSFPMAWIEANRGKPFKDGHGVPGFHAQLRVALLAGGRWSASRLLQRQRHQRHPGRRRAVVGHTSAADALHDGGRHDRWFLCRRTVEPAGGIQGHWRAGDNRSGNLEKQPGEGIRRQPCLGRRQPEHPCGRRQGVDPGLHVLARRQHGQPSRGGEDVVQARLCRRRRTGNRQQHHPQL